MHQWVISYDLQGSEPNFANEIHKLNQKMLPFIEKLHQIYLQKKRILERLESRYLKIVDEILEHPVDAYMDEYRKGIQGEGLLAFVERIFARPNDLISILNELVTLNVQLNNYEDTNDTQSIRSKERIDVRANIKALRDEEILAAYNEMMQHVESEHSNLVNELKPAIAEIMQRKDWQEWISHLRHFDPFIDELEKDLELFRKLLQELLGKGHLQVSGSFPHGLAAMENEIIALWNAMKDPQSFKAALASKSAQFFDLHLRISGGRFPKFEGFLVIKLHNHHYLIPETKDTPDHIGQFYENVPPYPGKLEKIERLAKVEFVGFEKYSDYFDWRLAGNKGKFADLAPHEQTIIWTGREEQELISLWEGCHSIQEFQDKVRNKKLQVEGYFDDIWIVNDKLKGYVLPAYGIAADTLEKLGVFYNEILMGSFPATKIRKLARCQLQRRWVVGIKFEEWGISGEKGILGDDYPPLIPAEEKFLAAFNEFWKNPKGSNFAEICRKIGLEIEKYGYDMDARPKFFLNGHQFACIKNKEELICLPTDFMAMYSENGLRIWCLPDYQEKVKAIVHNYFESVNVKRIEVETPSFDYGLRATHLKLNPMDISGYSYPSIGIIKVKGMEFNEYYKMPPNVRYYESFLGGRVTSPVATIEVTEQEQKFLAAVNKWKQDSKANPKLKSATHLRELCNAIGLEVDTYILMNFQKHLESFARLDYEFVPNPNSISWVITKIQGSTNQYCLPLDEGQFTTNMLVVVKEICDGFDRIPSSFVFNKYYRAAQMVQVNDKFKCVKKGYFTLLYKNSVFEPTQPTPSEPPTYESFVGKDAIQTPSPPSTLNWREQLKKRAGEIEKGE